MASTAAVEHTSAPSERWHMEYGTEPMDNMLTACSRRGHAEDISEDEQQPAPIVACSAFDDILNEYRRSSRGISNSVESDGGI